VRASAGRRRCARGVVGLGGADSKEWRPVLAYRAAHPPKPGQEPKDGQNAPDAGTGGPSGRQALLQRQVHLSEAHQAEAVALYMSGVPVKEIAQRFGIHRVTVSEICKRHGVELRSTTRRMTDEQAEIAARRYQEGASLAAIGKELDLNASTIWNRLIKAGVEMRPRRGK